MSVQNPAEGQLEDSSCCEAVRILYLFYLPLFSQVLPALTGPNTLAQNVIGIIVMPQQGSDTERGCTDMNHTIPKSTLLGLARRSWRGKRSHRDLAGQSQPRVVASEQLALLRIVSQTLLPRVPHSRFPRLFSTMTSGRRSSTSHALTPPTRNIPRKSNSAYLLHPPLAAMLPRSFSLSVP
jgi:hypothetical protein